ncbi:MAG: serine protease [Minisyncoccia bacterium]
MAFLQFLTHIVTSILVSYLALTNTLAQHIETLFIDAKIEPRAEQTQASTDVPHSAFEKVAHTSDQLSHSISNILREHAGFQRAALFASNRDDSPFSLPTDKSLTENIQDVLVNIYCQYKTDEYIRTTTGTGFFINPKGIILTNAHVAQFLLLENMESTTGSVSCVIRSGNPATPKYHAQLLYISPTWVFDNADLITNEAPRGTGERDYALLYVSESIDQSPLPARFPAINIATDLLPQSITGSDVMTAGYPAEALMRSGADAKLFPIVAETTLGTLYTFGSNYADIFSISESPVGEQGASGGPIVTKDAESVIGLIVTKGDEVAEGEHSLRALTLSYIDRTIIEETGFSLTQNMQGDIAHRGYIFKSAMVPFLAEILEEKLADDTH